MSHDRSPGLMAAIAAVVALTLGGWVFLRAIESDDAASTASSVATAQGQLIETSIGASIDRFDRVADSLTLADSADASFLATTAARAEVTSEDSSVTEIALVAVDGDSLVVLANVGAVDASAFVGRSIDRTANTDEVLARARDPVMHQFARFRLGFRRNRILQIEDGNISLACGGLVHLFAAVTGCEEPAARRVRRRLGAPARRRARAPRAGRARSRRRLWLLRGGAHRAHPRPRRDRRRPRPYRLWRRPSGRQTMSMVSSLLSMVMV